MGADEEVLDPVFSIEYRDVLDNERTDAPLSTTMKVDILAPSSQDLGIIKHSFIGAKGKARPVGIDVNGRRGRRAICVMYGDGMRYEVLDLDAEMGNDEDEDEDGDEESDEEIIE